MEILKTTRQGLVPNEYLFIKDNPKVFEGDGTFLNVSFNWDTSTGTFFMPSGMFNMPHVGDLIDQKMKSLKILRSVITKCTQDWDICKGELHILGYKEDYKKIIDCNQRPVV